MNEVHLEGPSEQVYWKALPQGQTCSGGQGTVCLLVTAHGEDHRLRHCEIDAVRKHSHSLCGAVLCGGGKFIIKFSAMLEKIMCP